MSEKRRYSGPPEVTLQAGGEWEESFSIRSVLTGEDMITAQQFIRTEDATTADAIRGTLAVAARLMLRWSLVDASGAPLPITTETVMALPFDMIKPLIDHVNASFLSLQAPAASTPAN